MPERSSRPTSSHPIGADDSSPMEVSDSPFPLTGSDGEAETPGAARSRTRTILLSALLAVGLAGASVIGYTVWRILSQKDARLTAPPQVAGLRVDESEDGRRTAEYLATALSVDVDFDHAVGAVYTDPRAAERGVLFFGGTTLLWTPGSDLDTAFELVSDSQGAVTGLRDVDPGALGGTMRCGSTTSDDGEIAVCGWADHGSLALALFPDRPVDESADLLRDIRSAAQTRR
jgi:hypothetical protein